MKTMAIETTTAAAHPITKIRAFPVPQIANRMLVTRVHVKTLPNDFQTPGEGVNP
jgi:hypothetical protein